MYYVYSISKHTIYLCYIYLIISFNLNFLCFTNNTAFFWSCLTQSGIHKKSFIPKVLI